MNDLKQWEPMFMDPHFTETIWGGTKIMTLFQKRIPSAHTGESCEVAALESAQSKIRNGFLAGTELGEAVRNYPEQILGYAAARTYMKRFPLEVKFIDATEETSVQVHPDDEVALAKEGPSGHGKDLMWFVVDAEPEAEIALGFKKRVTAEQALEAAENGTIENLLNYVPVKRGESYFVPAGMAHAIGSGILMLEVSESSDTEYRIYDYDRTDDEDNPRPLNHKKALAALKPELTVEEVNIDEGICCEHFQVYRRNLRGMQEINVSPDHFQIMMVLEGNGKVDGVPFKKGDAILLPAAGETVGLEGRAIYLQIL